VQEPVNSVTGLDIATLVIAVVGAITGVGSLLWNVVSHSLTGARVRVEVLGGWTDLTAVVAVPWPGFDPRTPPTSQFTTPVVAIRVRNVGRLPAWVTRWSLDVGDGTRLDDQVSMPGNDPLAHRLDGGEENMWLLPYLLLDAVLVTLTGTATPVTELTASVSLGTGRSIRSRSVPVIPPIIEEAVDDD
jgi:hypothetical protein